VILTVVPSGGFAGLAARGELDATAEQDLNLDVVWLLDQILAHD